MKKSLFVAAFATLALVACKKTETVDTTGADSTVVEMDSAAIITDTAVVVADSAAVVAPEATVTDSAAVAN